MITAWMSKGFPGELITPPAILDNDLNPRLDYTDNPKIRKKKKKLNGSCLQQYKGNFTPKKMVNLYILFRR